MVWYLDEHVIVFQLETQKGSSENGVYKMCIVPQIDVYFDREKDDYSLEEKGVFPYIVRQTQI